jgi:uncharacterized protein YbaR (Trm112 family)
MDKRLLDILCCPVSKTPVRPLNKHELEALNGAIAAGKVDSVAGMPVREKISDALITTDQGHLSRRGWHSGDAARGRHRHHPADRLSRSRLNRLCRSSRFRYKYA